MTVRSGTATVEHAIGPHGRFRLRQTSGSIRIRGVDGSTARVRELNDRPIAESFRIEASEGGLSLVPLDRSALELVLAIGRRSSPVLEIEVPRAADLSIESASAELVASGLSGRTAVRTASGSIALEGIGGTVELVAVSGDIRVVTDTALDLKAQTISGDISVRAARLGRAEISTTSGDVRLDAVLGGPGPFGIRSVSGDAAIVGRTGLRIEARTVTGEVTSDLPHHRETAPGRRAIVIGSGGATLAFTSVSGELRVTAPRDALPAEVSSEPERPDGSTLSAPDLPVPPAPPAAGDAPVGDPVRDREDARLDLLRALERGDLTVDAAMRRLAEIDGV